MPYSLLPVIAVAGFLSVPTLGEAAAAPVATAAPQIALAVADNPIEEVYYYRRHYYPYYYRGSYYTYHYRGQYFRYRYYRYGRWHYY